MLGLVLDNGFGLVSVERLFHGDSGSPKVGLFKKEPEGAIVGDEFGPQSVVFASDAGLPVSSVKRLCASAKLACASERKPRLNNVN